MAKKKREAKQYLGFTIQQWTVLGVIFTIIAALLGLPQLVLTAIQVIQNVEKVDLKVDAIKYEGSIHQQSENYIQFRVYNKGDKATGSLSFYYVRMKQVENTCEINETFFNSSYMCFLQRVQVDDPKSYCEVDIPPLSDEDRGEVLKYNFGKEKYKFIEKIKSQNCNITETLVICATDGKDRGCSNPSNLTLRFYNQ